MLGTIIVSLVLTAIVSAIIFSMIKKKRKGGHLTSCGGNCSACRFACSHADACPGL